MKGLRNIKNNKMLCIGAFIISIIVFIGLFAPLISKYDPMQTNLTNILQKPNVIHLLGTDELGRDLLSRILWGARTSLVIGGMVVMLGGIVGVSIGSVCGFYGGFLDNIVMRIIDTLMSFPTLLLALFFITIIGPGFNSAIIGVGVAVIPRFARIARGSALSIKEKEYIEAAKALGQNHFKILYKHVIPNCIGPIIVQASLTLGNSILTVASLGFLGLGVEPGQPEWGAMLSDARSYIISAPHVVIFPGIAIAIAVLGFNLLGDGFRDILDVRQQ